MMSSTASGSFSWKNFVLKRIVLGLVIITLTAVALWAWPGWLKTENQSGTGPAASRAPGDFHVGKRVPLQAIPRTGDCQHQANFIVVLERSQPDAEPQRTDYQLWMDGRTTGPAGDLGLGVTTSRKAVAWSPDNPEVMVCEIREYIPDHEHGAMTVAAWDPIAAYAFRLPHWRRIELVGHAPDMPAGMGTLLKVNQDGELG